MRSAGRVFMQCRFHVAVAKLIVAEASYIRRQLELRP